MRSKAESYGVFVAPCATVIEHKYLVCNTLPVFWRVLVNYVHCFCLSVGFYLLVLVGVNRARDKQHPLIKKVQGRPAPRSDASD